MAAQRQRQSDEHERGQREPARTATNDVEKRKRAGHDQRNQHHLAQQVHVVALAQLRCGQVLRKVKREHAEEAQARQAERDHARHQAMARAQFAVRFAEAIEFFERVHGGLDRRGAGSETLCGP